MRRRRFLKNMMTGAAGLRPLGLMMSDRAGEKEQSNGSEDSGPPEGARQRARSSVPATRLRRVKTQGLQYAENLPMAIISRIPPRPHPNAQDFQTREGFTLIESLDDFRRAIKQDNQKIRLRPGIYRAKETDPPMEGQEHIFAVNGSDNYFDLRGAVIETPVSTQSKLTNKAHVADSWHINGNNNTFEGGYFRNVLDRPYREFSVTENEFEVTGNNNTFRNCLFVIAGSVPFGYSDFYGKGGKRWGRLDKHSFMSLSCRNTRIINCSVYHKSFGHCVHLHGADGVLIKNCFFTGTLRPTNDIFEEKVGRAKEHDFQIMYRGERPIPRNHVIPLTEDGVRSYEDDKNITVINTTVERLRGCFQLLCDGPVTLRNVTVREAGNFSYDVSCGKKGKVVLQNCQSDTAYSNIFNLTRGSMPTEAVYDMGILSPPKVAQPTEEAGVGKICGQGCEFFLTPKTKNPLPPHAAQLSCGGDHGLKNSLVVNRTKARLVLDGSVRNCRIKSVGPVEDNGEGNRVT